MLNIIKIALVFAGTVIGAGYASGQEIVQYFLKYGSFGIYGLVLSATVFTVFACVILNKIAETKANSLSSYFGASSNKYVIKVYEYISLVFMFITYSVMISASGDLFYEHFSMPRYVGILLMEIICFIAFINKDGIVKLNNILTPMIIVLIVTVFVMEFFKPAETFNIIGENLIVSTSIYISYNSLSLVAILTTINKLVVNKITATLSAVLGGTLLLICGFCIWYIIVSNGAGYGEIPILNALSKTSKIIYIPVLYFAMATTAISNGVGVIENIKGNRNVKIILMMTTSIAISRMGFSTLVSNAYGFFGYIGIIFFVYIIVNYIKYKKN